MPYKYKLQYSVQDYCAASSIKGRINSLEEELYFEDDFEKRLNLEAEIKSLKDRLSEYCDFF